jgi:hypothetical protein
MNADALALALREIAETRALLECLITSSESFDYLAAKLTLTKLNRKIRDLKKLQLRLETEHRRLHPGICLLDFAKTSRASSPRREKA